MKLFLSDFNSSMLYSIDISDNIVELTYNSNKSKVYQYKHTNIDKFVFETVLIALNNGSVGKYVTDQRKNNNLQEI